MNLVDELILLLLNEDSGYFHQVPGWNLNCAVASAALADLALAHRVDTDPDSLYLTDPTETGDPTLDSILAEIAEESKQRNAQYWIERLAPRAESIVDSTLQRLVDSGVLNHHSGGFWTLSPSARNAPGYPASGGEVGEFVKTRVERILFNDGIPDPRDAIIVGLANACDVLHLIYHLDGKARERIEFICNVDLMGRSIAEAVSQSIAAPMYRRALRTRPIPSVPLREGDYICRLTQDSNSVSRDAMRRYALLSGCFRSKRSARRAHSSAIVHPGARSGILNRASSSNRSTSR